MDADDLASADELWWSWAVLTDEGLLPDGAEAEFDAAEHVLRYRFEDSWLSLQRIAGGRAVLWGRVAGASRDAGTERIDVLDQAPDWAGTDAVWNSIRVVRPGFLAWYSRDGWDTSTPGLVGGVFRLAQPLLRADPKMVASARSGGAESDLLRQALGVAHVAAQGAVRNRLKAQIHRQMRDTAERDRGLPHRPALLARWARISSPPGDFRHTVFVDEGDLAPTGEPAALPEASLLSLTNVLRELHRSEADEESGAWLVAQVRYLGGAISMHRGFDGLPAWYDGKGPTLRSLTWEMTQRAARWRPPWATLLPG